MKLKQILKHRWTVIFGALAIGAALTACGASQSTAESGSAASSAAGSEASGAASDASSEGSSEAAGASASAESSGQSAATSTGGDELDAIKKAGKLLVGVEGTYPPFTYHDDKGELTGYDVELAKAVAESIGVKAEFVESDWDSLLAGVDSGRLDTVINDVSVTDERKEKYDFSEPYLYIPQQVVVKSDNDSIKSLDDLKGKKVATNVTNAYAKELESYGATIIGIQTSEEAANLVQSGRADFCMFSPIILKDYQEQHPDAQLKVAFQIKNQQEVIAIPVRKGQQSFLDAVNTALAKLADDGTLVELSNKYFGGDYTKE